jgi:hypothetical protein
MIVRAVAAEGLRFCCLDYIPTVAERLCTVAVTATDGRLLQSLALTFASFGAVLVFVAEILLLQDVFTRRPHACCRCETSLRAIQ